MCKETYHILIDELELYSPSLLQELQGIKLNSCSLTVAIRWDTHNLEKKLEHSGGEPFVLNKIMRMSTQVYETIRKQLTEFYPAIIYGNCVVQHTVLGCKPEHIGVSSAELKYEVLNSVLKEAVFKVKSHPLVVVLCFGMPGLCTPVDAVVGAAGYIEAYTDKPVIAFTGDSSELEELRAFLRSPSGFLVTTADLYCGMEATSVISILNRDYSAATSHLNGLSRATTSLIYIDLKKVK